MAVAELPIQIDAATHGPPHPISKHPRDIELSRRYQPDLFFKMTARIFLAAVLLLVATSCLSILKQSDTNVPRGLASSHGITYTEILFIHTFHMFSLVWQSSAMMSAFCLLFQIGLFFALVSAPILFAQERRHSVFDKTVAAF